MHKQSRHGKWIQEMKQLEIVQKKLTLFQNDVASNQHGSPLVFVQQIKAKLALIDKNITNNNDHHHSFFNKRLAKLTQDIECTRKRTAKLQSQINDAEVRALNITRQCSRVSNHVSDIYLSSHINKYKSANGGLFTLGHEPIFENLKNPGSNIWYKMRPKLGVFSQLVNFNERKHNSLAHLFLTNNEQFIQSIDEEKLPVVSEIGYLAIQRLKDIHRATESTIRMKKIAGKRMREVMPLNNPESLLSCDNESLHIEIIKLLLHAELHPHEKVAWLGTARAVDATIAQPTGKGVYFNPMSTHFSWGLNRAWLQVAAHLGYTFQLIEQHFPAIEAALLSQDASKFIEQLILETRTEGYNYTSQYNGGDSTTATTQEILVLMDLGCIAHKNAVDNSISFVPSITCHEEPIRSNQTPINTRTAEMRELTNKPRLQKSHSAPSLFKASKPPAYQNRVENFIVPGTGKIVHF